MRMIPAFWAAVLAVTLAGVGTAFSAPAMVSYQGELLEGGEKFTGETAEFKFAIMKANFPDRATWSNDGTEVGEPESSILLQVIDGGFSVLLGDTDAGMVPLGAADVIGAGDDPKLRVWVDTGDGFKQLPDQRIASGAFALVAETDFDWKVETPNVYRLSGSVGIGTDTMSQRLTVAGKIQLVTDGEIRSQINLDNNASVRSAEVIGDENGGGRINLFDGNTNNATVMIASKNDGGSQIKLRDTEGTTTIELDGEESAGTGGKLALYDNAGEMTIKIDGQDSEGNGGKLVLYDDAGGVAIKLDAEQPAGGPSRIIVDVLQVNGADLSEQFDIAAGEGKVEPGMVVSIDRANPGGLEICNRSYDQRVAGIVSGAGGVRPGMLMGQEGTLASGAYPVALTGRVYCWVDATSGAVSPGDLLTTSETPGHAKKIVDHDRARGAVLGKAMTGLESGKGLVLVLVSLQ